MSKDFPAAGSPTPATGMGGLMLLGLAVALLIVGVIAFDRATAARNSAERSLAQAEDGLARTQAAEKLAQQNVLLHQAAETLEQHAQASGVMPRYWSKRQVNVFQQRIPRDQVNDLLFATSGRTGQLPRPDEFEVAVTQPEEGLFEGSVAPRQPIQITYRGTVNFRIADR